MDPNEVPLRLLTQRKRAALKVALSFLLFGLAWVLVSDLILYRLVSRPATVARIETAKGWTFVALTTVFIYAIVRRAVNGLQTAEARGDVILNSIADGVLLIGKHGRILAANPAAVGILGVAGAGELVGMGPPEFSRRFRLTYPDGRGVPLDRFVSQRALRGERVEPYQTILHRDDGSEVVVASSAAPIRGANGQIMMAVAVMRDITKVVELDRARDQLYAAAAHSLKTPMAIIKGHAQLLGTPASAHTGYAAQVIDRQCRRIDCLIQNLLVLSRLRSGELRLHPEDVDLVEVVTAAVRHEGAGPSGRQIDFQPLAHPRARVDRERMELVVRDLIEVSGARARPGTGITLTLAEADGWAELRAEYLRIEGEAPVRPVPTDASAATVLDEIDEHTGLSVGRHVVARLVQAHGGTYGVEELADDGESEWVRVPVIRPEGGAHVLH